jgi:zinc/manganese transport system substrate-binding protein
MIGVLAQAVTAMPMVSATAVQPLRIVAAENFYADIAQQIGGPAVSVTSILSNPAQDPHLFEVTPSAARSIATAQIVIYNGLDYDPWMAKLLSAHLASAQLRIVVAELMGRRTGDNPHIWYDPAAALALAQALAAHLSLLDPAHRLDYALRLARFQASMQPVEAQIRALRQRFAGVAVTATEPVLNELLDALALSISNRAFQRALMNNTEPSASELAAFETTLTQRRVRLLIYNQQTVGPLTAHMSALARANHIPVLAVSETEPAHEHYQDWLLGVLAAIGQALA